MAEFIVCAVACAGSVAGLALGLLSRRWYRQAADACYRRGYTRGALDTAEFMRTGVWRGGRRDAR